MSGADVWQDAKGNWVGVRQFTYPGGSIGYDRVELIKNSHSSADQAGLRAEAERRFAEYLEGKT